MKRDQLFKIAEEYNIASVKKSVFESLDHQCEEAARKGYYSVHAEIYIGFSTYLDSLSLQKLISEFAKERDLTFTKLYDSYHWNLSWRRK